MTTLTEGRHRGEFILGELDTISFDVVTLAAAAPALAAGTVLGKITASGKYAAYNDAASDGTEVAAAVLYSNAPDSASDQQVVVVARLAEVKGVALTGIDANGKADLAAKFIIVR